jgi:hypothetical protein
MIDTKTMTDILCKMLGTNVTNAEYKTKQIDILQKIYEMRGE